MTATPPAAEALTTLAEQVRRCNRCGFCQEVCPTYKVTGREFALARGRNWLMRLAVDGRLALDADPEIASHLYSCLLCGACAAACPPGVPTDRLVAAARAELGDKNGRPAAARALLRAVLSSPRRLAVPVGLVRLSQNAGIRWAARHVGILSLLRSLGRLDGLLPVVPRSSLRATLRRRSQAGDTMGDSAGGAAAGTGGVAYVSRPSSVAQPRRGRVAYFVGCLTDNLFPSVGEAVIGVLERNGYEVVVTANACCGVAHRAYGDLEFASRLAATNTSVLASCRADYVVSDCGSCLHALKEYPELLTGAASSSLPEAASALAERVRDVNQLLVEEGYVKPGGHLEGLAVTYHDPCHLGRGLGVKTQPRHVLAGLRGADYGELGEADWCCGGAGSYSVSHPSLADSILERKIGHVQASGANVLATSCPACLIQLQFGARRASLDIKVRHVVELLHAAYVGGG